MAARAARAVARAVARAAVGADQGVIFFDRVQLFDNKSNYKRQISINGNETGGKFGWPTGITSFVHGNLPVIVIDETDRMRGSGDKRLYMAWRAATSECKLAECMQTRGCTLHIIYLCQEPRAKSQEPPRRIVSNFLPHRAAAAARRSASARERPRPKPKPGITALTAVSPQTSLRVVPGAPPRGAAKKKIDGPPPYIC
jgi:hypothetical protein